MLPQILDSVLLFALAIPVVMQYRILPIPGTPYWLFGILFSLLVVNCFFSFNNSNRYKNWFLVAVLMITVGGATITAMVDRAKTAPVYGVHDIILQQEAAMRYLIVGKNPYQETYFGTPVEDFHYGELGRDAVNPALFHFVMPPWYLLFPFLFYYTSIPVFGFFDGRMALLCTMVLLLITLWFWFKDKAIARLAIVLTALSPAVIGYFIEGRSDVFALSWLMVSILMLSRKKYVWSGVLLALALLSKQTTWFMVPFFAVYLWLQHPKAGFWKTVVAAMVTGVIIVLPFLLWNVAAFIDSVILYLTGNTANSYPVSGYGLSMLLYDAGKISDIHAYYPFIVWQIGFALPVMVLLLLWVRKKPTESKFMLSYAVFLSAYWYLSRYFNNSHLGYLSMFFVLSGLKHIDEQLA